MTKPNVVVRSRKLVGCTRRVITNRDSLKLKTDLTVVMTDLYCTKPYQSNVATSRSQLRADTVMQILDLLSGKLAYLVIASLKKG